ncbi:hypothetical protein FRC06_011271, partial [Ceratobasidium sp. 370]
KHQTDQAPDALSSIPNPHQDAQIDLEVFSLTTHALCNATSTSEAAPERRRSNHSRRPSAHKIESDEYQASLRGSSRPPSPSAPVPKRKPRKLPWGARGDQPGCITQLDSDIGSMCNKGLPEPPATAGPQAGDSHVASQSLAGNLPKATKSAEAVRCASAYLGVDASRYTSKTIEKVLALAAIPDGGKEGDTGAMEIEGRSAPITGPTAIDQTGGIGERTPAIRSTESESELEFVELGPGDSVSQRLPRLPPSLRAPSHPPFHNSHPPHHTNEAETPDAAPMVTNTTGPDMLGSDEGLADEIEQACMHKRLRLAQSIRISSSSHPPSTSTPSVAWAHPTHPSTSHSEPLMPVLAPNKARAVLTTYQPILAPSCSLLEPPPMSDTHGMLAWAAWLAQHVSHTANNPRASTSCRAGPASQPDALYHALAQVLGDLASRLPAPTLQLRPSRPPLNPKHMHFVDDNAEFLKAEAALSLGQHFPSRGKLKLSDFPGLPRHIASLAIPDLIATACTQGACEVFGMISEWADDAFHDTWDCEVPDEQRIQIPCPLNPLMVRCVSWFRGESKKQGHPAAAFGYSFINPPEDCEDSRYNCLLSAGLLPNSFHFLDPETETDPYENPVLCRCIAAIFFWVPDSLGVVYHTKFNLIPIPAVAMVLTIMQHCIQEWSTGRFVATDLDANLQMKMYSSHLKGLLQYAQITSNRLLEFHEAWYKYGIYCVM